MTSNQSKRSSDSNPLHAGPSHAERQTGTQASSTSNISTRNTAAPTSRPKQPFMTLMKPFDVNPQHVTHEQADFEADKHKHQSTAPKRSSGEGVQPCHTHLDRPWGSSTRRKQLENSGNNSSKKRELEAPFPQWISEDAVDGPYHGLSGMKEETARRSGGKRDAKEK